jgi:hypothetical protein
LAARGEWKEAVEDERGSSQKDPKLFQPCLAKGSISVASDCQQVVYHEFEIHNIITSNFIWDALKIHLSWISTL